MKKVIRIFLIVFSIPIFFFSITGFIISDSNPDFKKVDLTQFDKILLSEIQSENTKIGSFKSSVKFRKSNFSSNNLISRLEIWNEGRLIETKELGFMKKMKGDRYKTLTIQFYDQTQTSKNSGIRMQYYDRTTFFGDIGTISLDLCKYGDLSGAKELRLFAKSLESKEVNEPHFSDLTIWKDYESYD